jgi:hypothetical protein
MALVTDTYRFAGGTSPWMDEVERSRRPEPRKRMEQVAYTDNDILLLKPKYTQKKKTHPCVTKSPIS